MNLEKFIRKIFRIRTLPNSTMLRKFMGSEFLLLADVGATGNPKGVWLEAEPFSDFILFDPDPRASMEKSEGGAFVYPVGLWSEQAQKTLLLAKNPEASSIYHFNDDVLNDFSNSYLHKVVAEEIISVDSMDNILSTREKLPDFIKVDAEGADLDILKGARKCLKTNCLGVFIEVSFIERHKGAGFFGDTDKFMRENNFQLMDLFPERWVRANKLSGIFTRHQVIWGDALYIINRKEFLRRLSVADPSKRRSVFFKFIFILMLYQLHDYANEIIEYSYKEKLITEQDKIDAGYVLNLAMGNTPLNIVKILGSIILSSIGLLLFIPVNHLWRKNLMFFRIQFGELCNIVSRFSMRRHEDCIVDLINPSSRL